MEMQILADLITVHDPCDIDDDLLKINRFRRSIEEY